MLSPLLRAVGQLDDPVFLGVVARSVGLSLVAFVLLGLGLGEGLVHLLPQNWGVFAYLAGFLGAVLVALSALWLFVPVALLIATLFQDRIAEAVDRRFYPALPQPRAAPLLAQLWDGLWLGVLVLLLQLLTLVLILVLPGVGLVLAWLVSGWAIGRGLFVGVAMRRLDRRTALAIYGQHRLVIVGQGVLLALAGTVPLLNLLVPVLGIAAMVHVLNGAATHPGLRLHGPDRHPLLR